MGRSPLAALSVDDLVELGSALDGVLFEVFKISTVPATLSIERRLAALLGSAWKTVASGAVRKAIAPLVRGPLNTRSINTFLRTIGGKLAKPLTASQILIMERQVKRIWTIAKRVRANQLKIPLRFDLLDKRAIAAISKHQVFWVGSFYKRHMSDRIRSVTEDVMLQQGLSRAEAGKTLRKALDQELGVKKGGRSAFARGVPAKFAGDPDRYLGDVAANAAHQARTFGAITAFDEAGATTFTLDNPMDERTGKICFNASAPVLMADLSQRPISEIKKGDRVVTGSGTTGVVESAGQTGSTDRLLSCRSFVGSFKVTHAHEIYTPNGWVCADNLATKAKVRVSQDLRLLQELRGRNLVLPESGAAEAILLSALLQGVSAYATLGRVRLRALREGIRRPQEGVPSREAEALLDAMQASSGAQRSHDRRVDRQMPGVQERVQSSALGGSFWQAAEVLLGQMQARQGSAPLRPLQEDLQGAWAHVSVLLDVLLQAEQFTNPSRVGGTGILGALAVAVRRGDAVRPVFDRLRGLWSDSSRGRWRLLAQAKRGKKGISNQGGWIDARPHNGQGAEESPDPFADLEDHPCFDWGDLSVELGWVEKPIPVYNLKVAGNDPTYIVAGVAVHNCQEMHGQVFTIETGKQQMQSILSADSPEDVKGVAPWLTGSAVTDTIDGAPKGSQAARDQLERAGVVLPPYHPRCRTEVIVGEFGTPQRVRAPDAQDGPPRRVGAPGRTIPRVGVPRRPPAVPTPHGLTSEPIGNPLPLGLPKGITTEQIRSMSEHEMRASIIGDVRAMPLNTAGEVKAAEKAVAAGRKAADDILTALESDAASVNTGVAQRKSIRALKVLAKSDAEALLEVRLKTMRVVRGQGGLRGGKALKAQYRSAIREQYPKAALNHIENVGYEIRYMTTAEVNQYQAVGLHYGPGRSISVHPGRYKPKKSMSPAFRAEIKRDMQETFVHEHGHFIDAVMAQGATRTENGYKLGRVLRAYAKTPSLNQEFISNYGATAPWEYWAEAQGKTFMRGAASIQRLAPKASELIGAVNSSDEAYRRTMLIIRRLRAANITDDVRDAKKIFKQVGDDIVQAGKKHTAPVLTQPGTPLPKPPKPTRVPSTPKPKVVRVPNTIKPPVEAPTTTSLADTDFTKIKLPALKDMTQLGRLPNFSTLSATDQATLKAKIRHVLAIYDEAIKQKSAVGQSVKNLIARRANLAGRTKEFLSQ